MTASSTWASPAPRKTSQLPSDLKALVYEFNPKTNTFNTTPVFSMNLGHPRGCVFSGYGTNEIALKGINAPKFGRQGS